MLKGISIKTLNLSFAIALLFTGCSPRIGVGIGGVIASADGMSASELLVDSETGIHGSVARGTDMRL